MVRCKTRWILTLIKLHTRFACKYKTRMVIKLKYRWRFAAGEATKIYLKRYKNRVHRILQIRSFSYR